MFKDLSEPAVSTAFVLAKELLKRRVRFAALTPG
jgi:hypothetical protein